MRARLALTALLLAAPAARADQQATRPILVEMFVSQACSSCPPADALLQTLAAQDKDILPLSLNVTYWNNLGWRDTDAIDATTARQFWYAGLSNNEVYTPEAVVDGTIQLVGSKKRKLVNAIAAARDDMAPPVPVSVSGGAMVKLTVGQGSGEGQIILYGYDSQHSTKVGAGENQGAVITEINVVRSVTALGPWNGMIESFTIPRPAGEHVAVLLQAKDGTVLGLAYQ
jgi:hypothetical protein